MGFQAGLLIGVIGAIFGSFLNVIIYRLPRGLSVISPGSKCPNCDHHIPLYRNIPVLSFILQKGKCACCGNKISIQYPAVEILSIAGWLWAFNNLVFLEAILFIWIYSILLAITWIDARHLIIPFPLILLGILGILIAAVTGVLQWQRTVIGAMSGGILLLGVYALYRIITKRAGLGRGDILLGMVIGGWLGLPNFIMGLFMSSVIGLIWAVIVSIKEGWQRHRKIPFGTCLSIGALSIFFLSHYYPQWYNMLFGQ